MDTKLIKKVEELNHFLVELQRSSKKTLGFTQTLEYKEIFFHVSQRFVIADLSPLAYVDLTQEINDGDVQTAIIRLYERLSPLLECTHLWVPLRPEAQGQILRLDHELSLNGNRIHTCTLCTAYGLGGVERSLPIVGRDSRKLIEFPPENG